MTHRAAFGGVDEDHGSKPNNENGYHHRNYKSASNEQYPFGASIYFLRHFNSSLSIKNSSFTSLN
jgi:hypothetical protein